MSSYTFETYSKKKNKIKKEEAKIAWNPKKIHLQVQIF